MKRLKIKRDIDLKELEKFGYILDYGCYRKPVGWRDVIIHIDNRSMIWVGDFDYDYLEEPFDNELVDDLIKAEFVETE